MNSIKRRRYHVTRSPHLHRQAGVHGQALWRYIKSMALPLRRDIWANHLPILLPKSGEVNTYVHIWVYKDAADRATKRAAMQADPDWQMYLQKSGEAGYLLAQRNNLMNPAPFAPLNH